MKKVTYKSVVYACVMVTILSLFLFGFIEIVEELREKELELFDSTVIDYIQGLISYRLTEILLVATFLGSVKWIAYLIITVVILLLLYQKISLAIFMMLSSGLGALFNTLLKWIFKRERPDIQPLITEQGFSFPSGHSMGSFIFYGSVAFLILHLAHQRRWKWLGVIVMILMVITIGISRIYLGVHYPSDVIGGYAAGGAWLTICILGFRYYEYRKSL